MGLRLIDEKRAIATLVLGAGAGPVERHAAEELQTHLEQIAGTRLPVADASPRDEPAVLLGRTPEVERLLGDFDWSALKEDGIVVRTVGDRLVLAGATPRGTLYAVYELLENVLGCRWLTKSSSVIPKRLQLTIEPLDITYVPPFRYREPFFSVACDADWAARNRANGSFFPLDEKRGGKISYAGFVHTFYALVPPEEHFKTHPEYFSELDGVRVDVGGQLCLTNPELIGVVTDKARQWLREQPDARILSISQNDWNGNCQCVHCRAMDEREGSPSGALVRFVNAVAERLEPEFPHVLFDTIAYTYTVAPPREARPRKNVIIRLCQIAPCCDGHPLEACDMNRDFIGYLKRWGEISHEVFIWDYFTNFWHYFLPFPNLDAILADVPVLARAGVTGMFAQGDGTPAKGSGEFAELRAYLFAKLLWDPYRDGKAVIKEFAELYYGPAAQPILEYIEKLHQQVRGKPIHFNLFSPPDQAYLNPQMIAEAERLFDDAERHVVNDPERLERVRTARLPLQYLKIRDGLVFTVKGNRYEPADPRQAQIANDFYARAAASGAGALRELGQSIDIEAKNVQGCDVVHLENDGLKLTVVPALGGRILRLRKGDGADWMHWPLPRESDLPFAGGYEEYSEQHYRSPGWSDVFDAKVSGSSVELSAKLKNGLTLTRRYALENGALRIRSTLTNHRERPITATLRAHPEFDPGDWSRAAVRLRNADGRAIERQPWQQEEGRDGSLWLRSADLPAGRWSLRRAGGDELAIEFYPGSVEQCLLSWDKPLGIVRFDMYTASQSLDTGQSLMLEQRWVPAFAT